LLDRLGFPPERTGASPPRTAVRLILLCAIIEIGQLLVISRHATLLDLMLNAAATLTGWTVAGRLSTARLLVRPRLRAANVRMTRLPLAAWGLLWAGLIIWPSRLVTLDTWALGYPLLIGNELDEDRPWTGEISYLALYDRALEPDTVRELAHRPPARDGTPARSKFGLTTQYRFDEPGQVEINPEGPVATHELSIRVPPTARWTSGPSSRLVVDERTHLSSIGPADLLTQRLSSTNAFSVEVWCRPGTVVPEGYARIVGISGGTLSRNFTLGQEKAQLVFRVRNRLNGPNGLRFELRSPRVLPTDHVQLVATYGRGASSLFVAGEQVGRVDLHQPSVAMALGPRPIGAAVAALLAALSLLIALPPTRDRPGTEILRRVAIGYAILAAPIAFMLMTAFRPAMGFYAWLGPAIPAAYLLVRRSSS
jgi:Concanavalin A-like lectin/glucanases superfamily